MLDQGNLPLDWIQSYGNGWPYADTFSVNGSFGVTPGDYGHWPGQSAQDGIRWVAGGHWPYGNGTKAIGQKLQTKLTVGQQYQISGYIMNDTDPQRSLSGG